MLHIQKRHNINFKKLILFFSIFISCCRIGFTQNQKGLDFFLGYGYYQGFTIGSEYYFKKAEKSLGLSIGYNKLLNRIQVSSSFSLAYNFAIKKKLKNEYGEFKWHINNSAVLWQLEDEFYIWRAISLIPSINRKFTLYKNLNMSFDLGPSFNIVLFNHRKTFMEAGWPYHIMPNLRILFIL